MIWLTPGRLALYDGYMWSIYCLCSIYVIYGIDKFLIWFPLTASFSVCVDVYPTSCWSILDSSYTLISRQWKYALFFSIVFRKEHSVTWMLIMLFSTGCGHCNQATMYSTLERGDSEEGGGVR